MLTSLLIQIRKFVEDNSHPRNRWFEGGGINIYLRRSTHYVNNEKFECIDIANVDVPNRKGKGIFTECLAGIEKIAIKNNLALYIENVLEVRFGDFFTRRGYATVKHSQPICMFKKFGRLAVAPRETGVKS